MTPARAVVARWHRDHAAEGFITDENLRALEQVIDAARRETWRAAATLAEGYTETLSVYGTDTGTLWRNAATKRIAAALAARARKEG